MRPIHSTGPDIWGTRVGVAPCGYGPPIMKSAALWALMRTNGTAWVYIGGVNGILQSVQREDGSGTGFNLEILPVHCTKTVWVFVRIED